MKPNEEQEPEEQQIKQENMSTHIFSASATMVGVCLTGISLFRVLNHLKNVNSVADNLLAIDALGFLASCLLSYASRRSRNARSKESIENVADRIFLLALIMMVVIGGLIAYESA